MSAMASCRSAERGGRQVVDLASAPRLELGLRLQPSPEDALAGQEGRLPVQLVFAASAARLQMTARVGLDTLSSIGHATATTLAVPRRVEGSRSPPYDEVRVCQHAKKTRSRHFPQVTLLSHEAGTAVLPVFCVALRLARGARARIGSASLRAFPGSFQHPRIRLQTQTAAI